MYETSGAAPIANPLELAAEPATLTDPVAVADRISAIDVLRGAALLGILLINITDFGLPFEGQHNLIVDSPRDTNTNVWFVTTVLFEGKMRALFSIVFGAGVILLTERFERRGDVGRVADIYYRRTLWLLAFGLVHSYFFWDGDILARYGLLGLFLYPFRKLYGPTLVTLGVLVLTLTVPLAAITAWQLERRHAAAVEAQGQETAGHALTRSERDRLTQWQDVLDNAHPDANTIQETLDVYRGGYWKLFVHRFEDIEPLSVGEFCDTVGMMLVGMGLMKLGVISAASSAKFYAALAVAGFAFGLPLHTFATWWTYSRGFDPIDIAWVSATYDPGRLAIALAYIGVVMLVVQAGLFRMLTASLAAVGRMALTNYLATTLVCTTIFNGYGFGLFGSLQRYQLYFVVLGIWAVQLVISPIWLRYFLFGPAEWAWRSLTYWQAQALWRGTPISTARLGDELP
ncbi:MAG TPA: DUF418 domain-containing protein [Pirellulales bacterium]